MKLKQYSILSLLTFGIFSLSAQIVVDSSDLYVSPDTINVVKTTNASILDLNDLTGSGNQSWDFTPLKADSVQQIIIRNTDNSNPVDNKFTDAKMVVQRPGEGNAYLLLTADSLTVDGFADFVFDAGITADVNLDPNLKLIDLPVSYLDVYSTSARIDSTIDSNIFLGPIRVADSIRVEAILEQTTTVGAYGPLKTVQTNFNTLRLKTVEKQTTIVYIHQIAGGTGWREQDRSVATINRYTWLAKDRGYQVAEVTTDSAETSILTAQFMLIDSLYGFMTDQVNPNCYGEDQGTATFKKVIGSNNITYAWSASTGSQTTATATKLTAGTHTVTVTDNNSNQTFVDSVVLTEPDSLQINIISVIDETNAGKDGSIEIAVAGGSPPYTFSWDKSTSNIALAQNLEGGTHTITVKDVPGCTKIITQDLTSAVGMTELHMSNIEVFPNPATSKIQISGFEGQATISIINYAGQLVLEKDILNSEFVSIENLEKGVYFLNIYNEEASTTHSIVVQ